MEAFLVSAGVVAVAEIGDKTQLLAILLAARYRQALPIIAGILVATIANHAIAAGFGTLVAGWLGGEALRWVLGLGFIAMAAWALVPDKVDEGPTTASRAGAFVATVLWLAATASFGWYVRHIGHYNVLYGSIATAILLLVWMYLLAIIALFGCEFNAHYEKVAA